MKTISQLFLMQKISSMLINIASNNGNKCYSTKVNKEIDCTYSHGVKLLNTLEELGLVETERNGRIRNIKLTEKGKEFAKHLVEIKNMSVETEVRNL
jgi:predicted transcriptional regulator